MASPVAFYLRLFTGLNYSNHRSSPSYLHSWMAFMGRGSANKCKETLLNPLTCDSALPLRMFLSINLFFNAYIFFRKHLLLVMCITQFSKLAVMATLSDSLHSSSFNLSANASSSMQGRV